LFCLFIFIYLFLVVWVVVAERPQLRAPGEILFGFWSTSHLLLQQQRGKVSKKFEKFREYIDFAISTVSGFVISPISQIAAECTPAAQATCPLFRHEVAKRAGFVRIGAEGIRDLRFRLR